jgi:sec-independent protein translocase protein TatB
MFDLNWAELLIIGFLALIVIGPEDLPDMFRQLGRFTAKLRQMSREFSRAMEDAAKQSGLKEAADDLKTATSSKSLGLDAVREAANKFEKWDPMKSSAPQMPARSLIPPPMPASPATVTPATTVGDAVVNDADEAADDLAAHEFGSPEFGAPAFSTPAPEPTIHGPATQALYDKVALRSQVLQEQTEKLKAIEAGTYNAATPTPTPAPAVSAPPNPAPAIGALTKSVAAEAAPARSKPAADYPMASEVTGPVPPKRSAKPKTPDVADFVVAPEAVVTGPAKTRSAKTSALKSAAAKADATSADASKKKTALKTVRKTASKADKA